MLGRCWVGFDERIGNLDLLLRLITRRDSVAEPARDNHCIGISGVTDGRNEPSMFLARVRVKSALSAQAAVQALSVELKAVDMIHCTASIAISITQIQDVE